MTTFGSVCSGIEAASVAWHPLGWRAAWLAEIEPFPSAVLAHHYPSVPNLGDMTLLPARIAHGEVEAPDVFCGGTPCQAFSVAGLRKSLDDARGNLSLTFVEIADEIDRARRKLNLPECVVFWENVPGVLSTADNAFGCFLGGLAGEDAPLVPPGPAPKPGRPWKWPNAGAVFGPQRAIAWRVLDAQYFGVAQRRRRVFVVASARKGFDPAAVLFEWDGLRRDTAPSREARQTAPTIPARSTAGGGLGTDFDCDGGLIAGTLQAEGKATGSSIDVAPALLAQPGSGYKNDFESETFLVQPTHTLRGEGFDASEGGTGRGTPLVPVAFGVREISQTITSNYGKQVDATDTALGPNVVLQPVAFDTTQVTSPANRSNPKPGDPCHPLAAGAHAPCIAFSAKDYGADAGSISPTLRAMSHGDSHANGGGQVAVAFHGSQDPDISGDVTHPVGRNQGQETCVAYSTKLHNTGSNNAGKIFEERTTCLDANSPPPALLTAMQVRRLTPTECERLQGFPDGYTNIPWRTFQEASRKGISYETLLAQRGMALRGPSIEECPDGPRYKALGNSWAVPVVRWIGHRIKHCMERPYALNFFTSSSQR